LVTVKSSLVNVFREEHTPHKKGKEPLCMNQFHRVFNTYKVPKPVTDELKYYFKTGKCLLSSSAFTLHESFGMFSVAFGSSDSFNFTWLKGMSSQPVSSCLDFNFNLIFSMISEREGPCPTNVIILRKGHIFSFDAIDKSGVPLMAPEIQLQMQRVADTCDKLPQGPGLATCTAHDRTSWSMVSKIG
jgi:hypothetical protein